MTSSYCPPKSISLVNTDIYNLFKKIELPDFNKYLNNYNGYIEQVLHDIKGNKSKRECYKKKILHYDSLFSILKVPKDITLNILVVENEPNGIKSKLSELKEHFKELKFFLVKDKFSDLAKGISNGVKYINNNYVNTQEGSPFETNIPNSFEFKEIDLILQDIFLGTNLSGAEIANLYFDVAPQAMVFLLTSMDIETLAASGYDRKVDRLISKDRIKGLVKYYYDRFHELYGPILWPVFATAKNRNVKAELTDKTSLQRLLGNIRSWTMEPKILFHGFSLPEMVDHEYRHTCGLWKMANNILGPFLERMHKVMSYEDRILLSLAIWLHDIGHRGDEHHFNPMEIRENHGAISESFILEYYDALGIGWLKDLCNNCGLYCRNKPEGCFGDEICSLRKLGLMCRYHQSTTPLTGKKLKELIPKLKFPSPYCIIGMDDFENETKALYDQQIKQWLDRTKDFGWFGTDIRTLDEFVCKEDQQLLKLTGMLRWLDAMHTHRDKVGSALEIKSFLSYLEMRKNFCDKRINEIDVLLDKTTVGSEAYLNFLTERISLDKYSELLQVQGIHLWRSSFVRDIKGEWFWDNKSCKWAYRIVFDLYESDPMDTDEKIKGDIELDFIKKKLPGKSFSEKWSHHVWEEVIESEIEGQSEDGKAFFMNYFSSIDICYCYKQTGSKLFELGAGE